MGFCAGQSGDARGCNVPRCAAYPRPTPAHSGCGIVGALASAVCLFLIFLAGAVAAQTPRLTADLRLAFWRVDLGGRGPGLALRDILGRDPAPVAKAQLIAHVAPDVLVLSGVDHDHGNVTLQAFRDLIADHGHEMAYTFAFASNAGLRTGLDMTGDGRTAGPDDTQGYGDFSGQKALAVLSRYPILPEHSRDFSDFLWRDLPGNLSPYRPEGSMPDPARDALQRLSSTGHWDVALALPDDGRLHLLVYQAGPPVFGGQNDRNLHRNHDETAFWSYFLNGALAMLPPDAPFVLMGGSNLDPFDGDGMHDAMRNLLAHPAIQDPQPASDGAVHAARNGVGSQHSGPHAHDTVHWPQVPGPGNLRVSYILPALGVSVTDSGVFWPLPDAPGAALLGQSDNPPTRHRLVWMDIDAHHP